MASPLLQPQRPDIDGPEPDPGPVDPLDRLDRLTAGSRPASPEPDAGPVRRRRRARGDTGPAHWRDSALDRLAAVAARTGVTPRAVLGLLLVGALVLAVLVVRLVLVEHRARPVPLRMTGASQPVRPSVSPSAGPSAPGAAAVTPPVAAAGRAATGTSGPDVVLVHVVGQVRRPGVVTLPAEARVEEALQAAGGATAKADLVRVNLARPVVDGEQIVVPKPGEPITGAAVVGGAPAGTGSAAVARAPVDLNTAGLAELDTLPGVGPVLAQRILDWRAQNGRFSTVDELGEVSGIGEKVLANLRPLVRV